MVQYYIYFGVWIISRCLCRPVPPFTCRTLPLLSSLDSWYQGLCKWAGWAFCRNHFGPFKLTRMGLMGCLARLHFVLFCVHVWYMCEYGQACMWRSKDRLRESVLASPFLNRASLRVFTTSAAYSSLAGQKGSEPFSCLRPLSPIGVREVQMHSSVSEIDLWSSDLPSRCFHPLRHLPYPRFPRSVGEEPPSSCLCLLSVCQCSWMLDILVDV